MSEGVQGSMAGLQAPADPSVLGRRRPDVLAWQQLSSG
jgi:hypothetical protein